MGAQAYMLQFLHGELPPTHSFSASEKESQHIPSHTQFPQQIGFLLRSLAAATTLIAESRQFLKEHGIQQTIQIIFKNNFRKPTCT